MPRDEPKFPQIYCTMQVWLVSSLEDVFLSINHHVSPQTNLSLKGEIQGINIYTQHYPACSLIHCTFMATFSENETTAIVMRLTVHKLQYFLLT